MPKVLITSTSFGKKVKAPLEVLKSKGYDLKFNDVGRPLSAEELIERLADCDGCIAGLDQFTAGVFAASPKLRIVGQACCLGPLVAFGNRLDADPELDDLDLRRVSAAGAATAARAEGGFDFEMSADLLGPDARRRKDPP